MRAVVEAPHARRVVARAGDDVFAVGSDADRTHVTQGHPTAVPLERAHLRASGEVATHARAVSSAEQNAALKAHPKTERLKDSRAQCHGTMERTKA
eukprot:2227732-Pleurochrysis_carterae.AAC.1